MLINLLINPLPTQPPKVINVLDMYYIVNNRMSSEMGDRRQIWEYGQAVK